MKLKKSGIALILSVGILAILSIVAVGLTTFSRLELRATENFTNQFRAELIAEAGIAYTVEQLKYASSGAKNHAYDTVSESWYFPDGVITDLELASNPSFGGDTAFAGGSYRLKVIDCASLVNINAPLPNSDAENDLKNTLTELYKAVDHTITQSEASNLANNIVNYRAGSPVIDFTSKEELKLVFNLPESRYDDIKDFITLYGDEDDGIQKVDKSGFTPVAGHSRRVFVNVNTASLEVLRAVLRPMTDNDGECEALIGNLISYRTANPFDGTDSNTADAVSNFVCARGEFLRFIENDSINAADRNRIITQTDPNTNATNSTHLTFDSGGYYEIEAIGTYRGIKRRIKKVVCIYHKIYETTKEEFDNNRNIARISTRDDIPLNIDDCYEKYSYDSNSAEFMSDALKLGFWDDFSDAAYSATNWLRVPVTDCWYVIEGGMLKTKALHADGVTEKVDLNFPTITLGNENDDSDRWMFGDFYAIAHIEDEQDYDKHALRFNFPWSSHPLGWDDPETYEIFAEPNPNGWHVETDKIFQEYMNAGHLLFRKKPHGWRSEGTVYVAQHQEETGPEAGTKEFGWIDLWNQEWNFGVGRWEWHYFSALGNTIPTHFGTKFILQTGDVYNLVNCGYVPNKTIHLAVRGETDPPVNDNFAHSEIYVDDTTPRATLAHTNFWRLNEQGVIALYGSENLPDFDNVRVIPEQGVYSSKLFDPDNNFPATEYLKIEWGTISATVTLPGNALDTSERVFLTTNFSSGENVHVVAGPYLEPPAQNVLPSGGSFYALGTYPYVIYRIYMYSCYNKPNPSTADWKEFYRDTPVVEDVTITYMPQTRILSQSTVYD